MECKSENGEGSQQQPKAERIIRVLYRFSFLRPVNRPAFEEPAACNNAVPKSVQGAPRDPTKRPMPDGPAARNAAPPSAI